MFREGILDEVGGNTTPLPGNGWGTTISGPAQPLVGSVAGPSPKRPNVNEQPLVGPFSQRLAEEWISGV